MIRTPRNLTAREFIKALQQDGFTLSRVRGSHHIYHHADARRVVVAAHRMSQIIPVGTLKSMINDCGWTDDDLQRLRLVK